MPQHYRNQQRISPQPPLARTGFSARDNRGGISNPFFREAALANAPQAQTPQMRGAGLAEALAMNFIMSNPEIKRMFEMQLRKMLVPQQARTMQQPTADRSVAELLAMSQQGMGIR